MNKDKYITLYSDEFPTDVWDEYCEILLINNNAHEINVVVKDVIVSDDELKRTI
jgi:hypothetical protein